jgi:hypothetical protein
LKKPAPIDPETSNKIAMASLGSLVITGFISLMSIASSTF